MKEVHPLTVIEAMAAGLPVVGIMSPGVGDTVQDGVTGYLAPLSVEALAEKMTWLVMDADQRHAMSRQARQASQAYAIERTAAIMLERYQQVVEARSRVSAAQGSAAHRSAAQRHIP